MKALVHLVVAHLNLLFKFLGVNKLIADKKQKNLSVMNQEFALTKLMILEVSFGSRSNETYKDVSLKKTSKFPKHPYVIG